MEVGCLKLYPDSLFHGGIANIYIAYEINKNINISDYPTPENCLFGTVKLTKNADIDKYTYSGYGIGFDRHGNFSFSGTGLGRNAIIFGVDMSSSTKIDNRRKDILILGKGPTQGLEHTLNAEKIYSIIFTEKPPLSLSLHHNKENNQLFVNGAKIIKFKPKDSEILPYPFCLGSISRDWSVDNMKQTGLNGMLTIVVLIMILLQLMTF